MKLQFLLIKLAQARRDLFLSLIWFAMMMSLCVEAKSEYVRFVDTDSSYIARIYMYLDMTSCVAYLNNVNHVEKITKDYNVERVVFLQQEEFKNIDSIKFKNNWKSKVIADEFQIYKDYYGFTFVPGIIFLDNEGNVLLNTRLDGAHIKIKQIKEILTDMNVKNQNSKNLEVLSKVCVTKNGKPVKASYHKYGLYDENTLNTYLKLNGKSSILVVDSTGKSDYILSKSTHDFMDTLRTMYNKIFWVEEGRSFAFLHNGPLRSRQKDLYIYDIQSNKTEKSILDRDKNPDTTMVSYQFSIANGKLFLIYNTWYNTWNLKNLEGFTGWSSYYVYDLDGNYITSFGEPSKFFSDNFLGRSYSDLIQYYDGNYYSLQRLQDSIRVWDENFKFVKYIPIKMGSYYNNVKDTIQQEVAKSTSLEQINEINLMRTYVRFFLFDEIKKHFLIAYHTESKSPKNTDIYKTFYAFFDINGNRLFEDDIELRQYSMPYYFRDGIIMAAESDSKNQVEIVKYKVK